MVNIVAGGYIDDKTSEDLVALYELLASNSQQKVIWSKRVGMHELNVPRDLSSQVAKLSH